MKRLTAFMARVSRDWFPLLLFVTGASCATKCISEGRLAFRPIDPFAFEGRPFEACCHVVDSKLEFVKTTWENNPVVFSCHDNNSDHAKMTYNVSYNGRSQVDAKNDMDGICVNITIWNPTISNKPGMLCGCQLRNRPQCNATQYVSVDIYPPSNLTFGCITYGMQNVTCRPDLPTFTHKNHLATVIKWKQHMSAREQSKTFDQYQSKTCDQYDTCMLNTQEAFLSFYPVLDLSMTLVYNPCFENKHCVQHNVTVTSDWLVYDSKEYVLLDPMGLPAIETNSTTIKISWDMQSILSILEIFGDKIARINYIVADERNIKGEVNISIIAFSSTRTLLSDLYPFTNYSICTSAKLVKSCLWSEPSCVQVATKPDVPAISPKTTPNAFSKLNASSVMVYWQLISNWDWNFPPNGSRKYILQERSVSSEGWKDSLELDWTSMQTMVTVRAEDDVDLRVVAANTKGRAGNSTVIKIPKKDDILKGPENIKVEYDDSKKVTVITWQPHDVNVQVTVFLCQEGSQPASCLNSLEWKEPVKKGDNSLSIPTSDFLEVKHKMYGVAFSRTDGTRTKRSGIHWQRCYHDNGRPHGDCEVTQRLEDTATELTWVIPTLVSVAIVGVIILLSVVVYIYRRRKRKTKQVLQPRKDIIYDSNTAADVEDNYGDYEIIDTCNEGKYKATLSPVAANGPGSGWIDEDGYVNKNNRVHNGNSHVGNLACDDAHSVGAIGFGEGDNDFNHDNGQDEGSDSNSNDSYDNDDEDDDDDYDDDDDGDSRSVDSNDQDPRIEHCELYDSNDDEFDSSAQSVPPYVHMSQKDKSKEEGKDQGDNLGNDSGLEDVKTSNPSSSPSSSQDSLPVSGGSFDKVNNKNVPKCINQDLLGRTVSV